MEQKKDAFYCLLQCSNDIALKQFQALIKAHFPPTHLICQMKPAIDAAARGKPPLIKPPTPDALSLSGDLVNTVVHNWLQNQQKKPPQKPPSSKKNPKQTPKGKQQDIQQESTPRAEPEIPGPIFVYLPDYPKNTDQLQWMISSATPVVGAILIDLLPPDAADKKATMQAAPNPNLLDMKTLFSKDIPIAQFSISQTGTNEEASVQILNTVHQFLNAYRSFRAETVDHKTVTIPKYPPDPVMLPQLPVEKTTGKGSSKAAAQVQQQPIEPPTVHNEALKNAYKQAMIAQIEEFLSLANHPIYSPQFQHYSELLPKFAMPASLANIFKHKPDYKDPFIFTMRAAAYHNPKFSYHDFYSVFVTEKFEEMVNYPIGERRHTELIPLEFLPNIMAPLITQFPNIKTCDFAGTTLLAFYYDIPEKFPVSTVTETFNLPVTQGFGSWYKEHEEFPSTCEDIPPQTEFSATAGYSDSFSNLPSPTTSMSTTRYFDEGGMKIETNKPITNPDNSISNSFLVTYNNKSKTSFQMLQRQAVNTNEEEDDDNIEVSITVRASLSKNCEFLFEHNPNNSRLSLFTSDARVESNLETHNITMVGAKDETHRIITSDGELIKFTPNPVIYRPDGSIQTKTQTGWTLVDKDGNGYVKRNGTWFKDPQLNAKCETLETYFSNRKVTNLSNGVMFITDDNEETITFPDGTKYFILQNTYKHPIYPDVHIGNKIVLETKEFKATYEENHNVLLETKDLEHSMNFLVESGHLIFYYGQFKNSMTMVDLVTGTVANAGAHRCVFYLNDDWEWQLGRQLCSKKEIVQHFQDGDFVDRLQPVEEVEQEELMQDISNGHKPRLFIIDHDGTVPHVQELISSVDFQSIADSSSSRISKEGEKDVTFWFDTTPKTYREMTIWTKLTPEEKKTIHSLIDAEHKEEDDRKEILKSVGDSKWRELENQQRIEEYQVWETLAQYGIKKEEDQDQMYNY